MIKNKYKKIFLLVAFSACSHLYAQFFTGNPNDTNYFQIVNSYLQNYPGHGEDTSEAIEFTQFRRWQRFWAPRLGSVGSFKIAGQARSNYISNYNPAYRTSSFIASN